VRTLLAAVALAAITVLALEAQPTPGRLSSKTGTVVTPRNFPKQTAEDLSDMFRLNAELGSFAVVRLNWNDVGRFDAARILVSLAEQRSLTAVLELNPFKADGLKGASLDPGKALSGRVRRNSFADPAVADAYSIAVLELAQIQPEYLGIASDVNLYALSDPAGFDALVALYRKLHPQLKKISPTTKVFVTFQWDAMQQQSAQANRRLVDAFGRDLDVLAFTSEPRKRFEKSGPDGVPSDYYSPIAQYQSGDRPVFLEVNWPSDGRNGEADQAAFIRALPALLRPLDPSMLAWTFLHDVRVLIFNVRAGLIDTQGRPKPAFAAFRDVSQDRPQRGRETIARTGAPRSSPARASRQPAYFGIYTARLDGTDVQAIMTSPDHEMTHPRVSPDGKRIVLTRYNNRGRDGKATEAQGYDNTEIMVVNLDGTGLETIIPAKAGVIAANGAWTPDGRSLIFISTDNPQRQPEIRQMDLATRKVTRVPTPQGLAATDPHWEGSEIVFPVKGKDADALWVMNADGSNARQVTRPSRSRRSGSPDNFGDFDPKLSPDTSKVAFMRIYGGDSWHVMVLDRRTGEERNLTPDGVIEGLPTWSGDGRLLLYRHIDKKDPAAIGLYTMTPEGNNRKRVPLPRGFLYNHATFFPADGSSDKARIIYTGTVAPGL
jgi:Tol biopolymer transport system component